VFSIPGTNKKMNALFIPWDSHQQMVIADPGPWVAKIVPSGVFAYCPLCHAFAHTKLGAQARGAITCSCHSTRAELVELPKEDLTTD